MKMRWVESIEHMGRMRKAYRLIVIKYEGKIPLQGTRHRW
jgi:hypothetical protein